MTGHRELILECAQRHHISNPRLFDDADILDFAEEISRMQRDVTAAAIRDHMREVRVVLALSITVDDRAKALLEAAAIAEITGMVDSPLLERPKPVTLNLKGLI